MTTATEVKAETQVTTQVYRVYIKTTPQALWDAITKPEWTERYGYGGHADFDLRRRGKFRWLASPEMRAGGSPEVALEGEVIESDPPRKLVQTWRLMMDAETAGEDMTRLTYEIEEMKGGLTKLTLTHDLTDAPKHSKLVGASSRSSARAAVGMGLERPQDAARDWEGPGLRIKILTRRRLYESGVAISGLAEPCATARSVRDPRCLCSSPLLEPARSRPARWSIGRPAERSPSTYNGGNVSLTGEATGVASEPRSAQIARKPSSGSSTLPFRLRLLLGQRLGCRHQREPEIRGLEAAGLNLWRQRDGDLPRSILVDGLPSPEEIDHLLGRGPRPRRFAFELESAEEREQSRNPGAAVRVELRQEEAGGGIGRRDGNRFLGLVDGLVEFS